MQFKQFLEAIQQLDPYEALKIFGLEDKAGQIVSEPEITAKYRQLAIQYHPDRYSGGEAQIKKINLAAEVLIDYAEKKKRMPSSPGPSPQRPVLKGRPDEAPSYSEADLSNWANSVAEKGYFQTIVRAKAERLPFMSGLDAGPIGSKERTFKLTRFGKDNAEGIISTVQDLMKRDRASYPNNIVAMDINERWNEAWVTYAYPFSQDNIDLRSQFGHREAFGYRSVSFQLPPKPKKKGGGMKKHEVEDYLRKAGLQYVSSGHKNAYYGLSEHGQGKTPLGYIIKLQPRAFLLVLRRRLDRGYKKEIHEIKLESVPYGTLRPEVLDVAVKWVRDKYAKDGLGEE